MPWVEFHNCGAAGIIRDTPPHELAPEAWSNGRNVRFRDDKVEQAPGWLNFDSSISGSPTYVFAVPRQGTSADMWVYCGDSEVWAYDGSANHKITASSISATGQNTWTSTLLSGVAVVNYGNGKPLYWTFPPNTATTLTALPDWSASWTCKALRTYKNYLVALNMTESGTLYPFRIRWSHAATSGAVPTSWNAADTTKDAGFTDLIEGGDAIVDGLALGDQFLIYKETSTWSMRYVAGQFIFGFSQVYPDIGLMSRNAIAPIGRQHLIVSQQDIYVHDGVSEPQALLPARLRRYWLQDLDRTHRDKVFVVPNKHRREVWVCYPDNSSGRVIKALVWSYENNTWSVRDLPACTAMGFGGTYFSSTTSTWGGVSGAWTDVYDSWDEAGALNEFRVIAASKEDRKLYLMDEGYKAGEGPYTSWIERRALPLFGASRRGEPKPLHHAVKQVRSVWPRMTIRKAGSVNIYVGYQDDPLDTPVYSGPFPFNPANQRKIDCRVTGRFIAIKFESNSDLGWRLDSFGVEADIVGRY